MRYYFFKTSMQNRNGTMRNTLRALPGQTFPDGSPVSTELNVQAPKEKGTSANGCRLEYPEGTVFASTHLEVVTTTKATFYSVYDSSKNEGVGGPDPNFFPVNADGKLNYVSPQHMNQKMNAAYAAFAVFGTQDDDDDEDIEPQQKEKPKKMANKKNAYTSPADKNGKAHPADPDWSPVYQDQLPNESSYICAWLRMILAEKGIRTMDKRPKVDTVSGSLFEKLFACGETASTLASRLRFEKVCTDQKMDVGSLAVIKDGPLEWYLGQLMSEHQHQEPCTADRRDPANPTDVDDAAFLVYSGVNALFGGTTESYRDKDVIDGITKALSDGWTIDDMLHPDQLDKANSLKGYVSDIANGVIPMPEHRPGESQTLLSNLMKNPKFKRPSEKDGFYVSEEKWRVLARNLSKKKNTMLVGPTGSGKSELVKRLCEQTGTPFTIIQMGAITDPTEQLVGKMDLDPSTNGTRFDWADFALAIQRPGVVLLDEINRVPRNGFNILFNVLDGFRELTAPGAKNTDSRTIKVNPDCVFFATANIGAEYTGTGAIDSALRNRFMLLELDYLDIKEETAILKARTGISTDDAKNIATVAANIRSAYRTGSELEHSVSTRETLECAEMVKDGFEVQDAMEICFLPSFEGGINDSDPNCERGKVQAMIAKRFNNN